MPTECERSVTSPSSTSAVATTTAPATVALGLKDNITDFYEDLQTNNMMEGDMSTSQTSTTSNGSSCNGGRKTSITSADPTAYVAKARVTRPNPPPPPYNPMQFVQIKPCHLYQTAQEQLKKAEEVKKIKEIRKEEPEDWQNNLDNWKSSRRKRVEHIIDRVVEVKKLELEEHDRTRRKSKTFSEMIEERGDRPNARPLNKLVSLAVYAEDEANDLSDLGIGTSSASGKSSLSEDYDNNSVMSDNAAELDKAITNSNNKTSNESTIREYISSPGYETSSSTAPASSPDPCEYTYEGAIQDYKQRVSRAASGITSVALNKLTTQQQQQNSKESTPERAVKETAYPPRRGSKIEDRLMGFEVQSPSEECIEKNKVVVPKVDISKRKEIFEQQQQQQQQQSTEPKSQLTAAGISASVPRVTLRDRFKMQDSTETINEQPKRDNQKRLSGDITSIKERLQNLEQQQNLVNGANGKTAANKLVDIPVPPLKERLSSLQNAATKEEVRKPPVVLIDARQLEIMKSEDQKVKQSIKDNAAINEQQQHQQQQQQEHEISVILTKPDDMTAEDAEIDKDDSGIHTADDIDTEERLQADIMKKEQELKLNAAIEALAMEEKQLSEAANAVNQIEAEFEELSLGSVAALPPLASSNSSATPITNDHMEYSINEALELALEAIDKETIPQQQQQQQPLQHQQPENLYPTTVPSSNSMTKNIILTDQQDAGEDQQTQEEILRNKTDEEKCEKLQMNENLTLSTIKEKSEEEISKEPIYENIIATTTTMLEVDVALQAPKTSATTSSIMMEQEAPQLIPSMISNQIDNNQQQQQPEQILKETNQNQIKTHFSNNNNNNNNSNHNQIQKSIQNLSNQLQISQINRINCPNSNNNNVDELTNAFANTTITTTTTTINKQLTNNNNKNNIISNSSDLSSMQNTILFKESLTINNEQKPTSNHKPAVNGEVNEVEEDDEDYIGLPNSNENMCDLMTEPYYQVPKSSEPYYDAPKHLKPVPVYENIEIYFNGSLNGDLSSGGAMSILQPPKEKPPPPPVESPPPFDDVDSSCHTDNWSSDNTYETLSRHQIQHHKNNSNSNNNNNSNNNSQHHLPQDHPSPPIKRMNSTRRIKKELRNKRSSFLGIEGSSLDDDESYLELTVAPPPDMAQLLQEERRLEKQLYLKAGLCDSSDTGESRDSGVSENHSRQSSEHYTNSSEENETHDDSTSPLTLQTQNALATQTPDLLYQNDCLLAVAPTPLLQTVKGNSAESWTESATVAAAATQSLSEATATANAKMMSIEEKIREQEEVLRVERELLQLEQEELKRQRENLLLRETMARRELQHGAKMLMSANRRSLQDLNGLGSITVHNGNIGDESLITTNDMNMYQQKINHAMQQQQQKKQQQQLHNPIQYQQPQQIYANIPNLQQQYYHMETDYRKSMSDINEFSKRMMSQALPPPAPPSKPMRAMHVSTAANNALIGITGTRDQLEQNDYVSRQRHSLNSQNFGGSLVKIASPPPTAAPRGSAHIYSNYHHQSVQNLSTSPNNPTNNSNLTTTQQSLYPGNMSRNTLHALSATPKPKYTDGWVQVQQRKSFDSNLANDPAWMSAHQQKRKSMPDTYYNQNNNHWLIQEAEQRRLVEQQQRHVVSSNSTPVHQANMLTNGSALHSSTNGKPLPDSIIQTLTERVQSKGIGDRKRNNVDKSPLHAASSYQQQQYNKVNKQQPSSVNSVIQLHSNIISATAFTSSSNGQPNSTTTLSQQHQQQQQQQQHQQEKVLSVSGKKKCSHCGDELGRGAAMIIESLLLFYHINCFKCCVCHVQLGDGLNGTDVRVRNHKLHCQNCYSSDDGIKFSCV